LKAIGHGKAVTKTPRGVLIQVNVGFVAVLVRIDCDIDPLEKPGVIKFLACKVDPRIVDRVAFMKLKLAMNVLKIREHPSINIDAIHDLTLALLDRKRNGDA
jgi:hypothetical protein